MIDLNKLFNVFAEHAAARFYPQEWDAFLQATRKYQLRSSPEFAIAKSTDLGDSDAAGKAHAFIARHFSELGSTDAERLMALDKGAPNLMEWAIYESVGSNREEFCDFLDANWDLCPEDWKVGALENEKVGGRFNSKASSAPNKAVQPVHNAPPVTRRRTAESSLPPVASWTDRKATSSTAKENHAAEPKPIITKPVFIIHGHDDDRKLSIYNFLHNITNIKPIILHQQASDGETVIEKLVRIGSEAGYAVALLTADDIGRSAMAKTEDEMPRGRQNVVFEAGYFTALLGRKKVALLKDKNVENIGDLNGVVYISLDSSTWKHDLAVELQSAGYKVDWPSLHR